MYTDPDGHDDILSNLVTMFSVWLAKKKYGNSNKKVSLDASAYINSKVTSQANDYYNASGEKRINAWEKVETGAYLYENAPTIIKNLQEERNKTVYNGKVSAASVKENVTTGTGLFLIESHQALTYAVQNPGNALYNLSSFLQPDWQVKAGYTFGQRFQEYANADVNTRIILGTQDTEFVASMVAPEIPKGFKALKSMSAAGKLEATFAGFPISYLRQIDNELGIEGAMFGGFNQKPISIKPTLVERAEARASKLTSSQKQQIETLRNGGEVKVKSYEEARALLDNMRELRPATEDGLMPNPYKKTGDGFADKKGTYRGDLINKENPDGPVHPGVDNENHKNFPHYNIKLPDGNNAAIIITDNVDRNWNVVHTK